MIIGRRVRRMNRFTITALITAVIILLIAVSSCSNETSVVYETVPADTTSTASTSTSLSTDWDNVPPAFPQVPQVTAPELKKMIDDDTVIVLDVRDPTSYAYYHIPTAVNLYYDVSADPMDLTMRLWNLPGGKTIVFYCNCPDDNASGYVAKELIEMGGYDDVKDLKHGLTAWEAEGYPIVTGSNIEEFVTTTLPFN